MPDPFDDKLCECGCGNPAPIAKLTNRRQGHIAGRPVRFIQGHNHRSKQQRKLCACGCGDLANLGQEFILKHHYKTGSLNPYWKGGRSRTGLGYMRILRPEHPRADKSIGYVLEHIIIAEKALGRDLPLRAVVHHANQIENDNRNCNLVICEDQGYHNLLHQRLRAFLVCGHATWRKCQFCQTYDDPSAMYCSRGKWSKHYHMKCRPSRSAKGQLVTR